MTSVAIPAASGALGLAGGLLLGRTVLQRDRKVFGVPVPGMRVDFSNMSKSIGNAGQQFGKLAREVQAVREKVEQVARVFS